MRARVCVCVCVVVVVVVILFSLLLLLLFLGGSVFDFKNLPCWTDFAVSNSRPYKSGEFTHSSHTPFGVPQRLPEMSNATGTVC